MFKVILAFTSFLFFTACSQIEFSEDGVELLALSSAELDFGNVALGESVTLDYRIHNVTENSIDSSSVVQNILNSVGSAYTVEQGDCSSSIEPLQYCSLRVTFAPVEVGSYNQQVETLYNLSNGAQKRHTLLFRAVARATPLLVEFTSPTAGTFVNAVNQNSFSVSGNCNLANGQISFNQSVITTLCDGSNFTADLDFSTVSEGLFSLVATIENQIGATTNSAPLSLNKVTNAPTLTISNPSVASINSAGTSVYEIAYSGATTINLTNSDISLNGTTVGCSVNVVDGTTSTPDVEVTGCSGNGNVSISIAANTANDLAGNQSLAVGPSNSISVDNSGPSLSIGSPSPLAINSTGTTVFVITYTGANTVNLTNSNVTLNGASSGCSVNVVDGTTSTPNVEVTGCSGNGNVSISIASNTASDNVGNQAPAVGPSSNFTVDNQAPTLAIGAPSPLIINSSSTATFTLTYTGATSINLTNSNVTLNGASSGCSVNVVDGTTTTPDVEVTGCSGNGNVSINIASNTASDAAGNQSLAVGPSGSVTVDNSGPTISIGMPNFSTIRSTDTLNYEITYTGADAINLTNSDVTINGANTNCNLNVVDGTSVTPEVLINGCSGDGNISISIAVNTASDTSGNQAPAAGPSASVVVDNTGPSIAFSAPSASTINNTTPTTYTVTYSGASSINLLNSDVTVNGASTGCSVNVVDGTTPTPDVQISGCSDNGSISISIGANTANDAVGNQAPSVGPSSNVTVDNSGPTISIGSPDRNVMSPSETVAYVITYSDATTVNLISANIQLIGATSNCSVSIVDGTTLTPEVRITGCNGTGEVSFNIAANTASDDVGNQAPSEGPSESFQLLGVTYPSAASDLKYSVWAPISPTVNSGAPTNYSISPALPNGLNIDNSTGVISGIPIVSDETGTDYTITIGNGSVSINRTINIIVNVPDYTWYGFASDDDWSNPANWKANAVPPADAFVYFDDECSIRPNGRCTSEIDVNYQVRRLYMKSTYQVIPGSPSGVAEITQMPGVVFQVGQGASPSNNTGRLTWGIWELEAGRFVGGDSDLLIDRVRIHNGGIFEATSGTLTIGTVTGYTGCISGLPGTQGTNWVPEMCGFTLYNGGQYIDRGGLFKVRAEHQFGSAERTTFGFWLDAPLSITNFEFDVESSHPSNVLTPTNRKNFGATWIAGGNQIINISNSFDWIDGNLFLGEINFSGLNANFFCDSSAPLDRCSDLKYLMGNNSNGFSHAGGVGSHTSIIFNRSDGSPQTYSYNGGAAIPSLISDNPNGLNPNYLGGGTGTNEVRVGYVRVMANGAFTAPSGDIRFGQDTATGFTSSTEGLILENGAAFNHNNGHISIESSTTYSDYRRAFLFEHQDLSGSIDLNSLTIDIAGGTPDPLVTSNPDDGYHVLISESNSINLEGDLTISNGRIFNAFTNRPVLTLYQDLILECNDYLGNDCYSSFDNTKVVFTGLNNANFRAFIDSAGNQPPYLFERNSEVEVLKLTDSNGNIAVLDYVGSTSLYEPSSTRDLIITSGVLNFPDGPISLTVSDGLINNGAVTCPTPPSQKLFFNGSFSGTPTAADTPNCYGL